MVRGEGFRALSHPGLVGTEVRGGWRLTGDSTASDDVRPTSADCAPHPLFHTRSPAPAALARHSHLMPALARALPHTTPPCTLSPPNTTHPQPQSRPPHARPPARPPPPTHLIAQVAADELLHTLLEGCRQQGGTGGSGERTGAGSGSGSGSDQDSLNSARRPVATAWPMVSRAPANPICPCAHPAPHKHIPTTSILSI